jgi:DNA-binding response OmpR family regulator
MTILLVEDSLELATLVTEYLEKQGFLMDYASDGRQAINLLSTNHYELLLLDLNLPRVDGLEVCRQAKLMDIALPVIILTARDSVDESLEGFAHGADDYITKPFDLRLLKARIEAVNHRYAQTPKSRGISYKGLELISSKRSVKRENREIKLTPITYTILEALLKRAPEPVSRAELEQAVYGDDPPDDDVLRYHIYHLRKMIDKPFDKPMLHTLAKQGYRIA